MSYGVCSFKKTRLRDWDPVVRLKTYHPLSHAHWARVVYKNRWCPLWWRCKRYSGKISLKRCLPLGKQNHYLPSHFAKISSICQVSLRRWSPSVLARWEQRDKLHFLFSSIEIAAKRWFRLSKFMYRFSRLQRGIHLKTKLAEWRYRWYAASF